MRAVVVYESMYGNTHVVAERIGAGLSDTHDVTVVAAEHASSEVVRGADLLVVGGPTHVHGMSSHRSRQSAVEQAAGSETPMDLDPDAEGEGLRDWFHHLPELGDRRAAAFDTRFGGVAPAMSGRASKGIARRLRRHGMHLVVGPESFLVDEDQHLVDGEDERATAWGSTLGQA